MSLSQAAGSAIIAGMRAQADLVAAGRPQFETALASHLTGNRLAGGVAGVVYGDELAWSAGTGFADQAAPKASDPAMLYAIASITKTLPARPSCSCGMLAGWTWTTRGGVAA